MPTTLPNGLTIWNVTPHELRFWFEREGVEVVAPSDTVISAMLIHETKHSTDKYSLQEVTYHATHDGKEKIREIREQTPDALIVGSVLAAQGFPGEIVASIPHQSRRYNKGNKQVRPDRFTIFEEN